MPYFHASIGDFEDGSSFEIWILHPRRLLIVPGPKCSVPALMRFHAFLDAHFGDGEIGEYERKEIAT